MGGRWTETERAALLPVPFFMRPADVVARELLGCVVVSRAGGRRVAGRIVETEAYLGAEDPASHAYRGRRHAGNAGVYSAPGHWYVYRSYGLHWCANVCCAGPSPGSAVLLRALEPVAGLAAIAARRATERPRLLLAGPGRLAEGLGITRALDGRAIGESAVWILAAANDTRPGAIAAGPRVGISRARDWPLRFGEPGAWLSRPMSPASSRRRPASPSTGRG